jgi:hypothetical protein
MNTGILHLHSGLPYVLLVLLIASLLGNVIAWQSNKQGSKMMFTLTKVTFILSHIQLLVGLFVLFLGEKATAIFSQEGAMKTIMGDSELRLAFVEHPLTMIIAIVFITLGYIGSKKKTGSAQAKRISIFYGVALLLVLIRIPWQAWLG